MSDFYGIDEHLVVTEYAYSDRIACYTRHRLSELAAIMLQGEASISRLELTADGQKYTFAGSQVTPQLQEIIIAMGKATSIDFIVQYSYTWRPDNLRDDAAPFRMCKMLDQYTEDDLEGIFYSMYNQADYYEDHIGTLCAYGKKNDTFYHGVIEYEPIHQIPETGAWFNPNYTIMYEPDDLKGINTAELREICGELVMMGISGCQEYVMTDESLRLTLDQFHIDTREQFERFIQLCSKLTVLTEGEAWILAEFMDTQSVDGHFFKVEFNKDGSYQMYETEVK